MAKTTSHSFRFNDDDAQKFKELAQKSNSSQKDYFHRLVVLGEKTFETTNSPRQIYPFTVYLRNNLTQFQEHQQKTPFHFFINGYPLTCVGPYILNIKDYESALQKEFYINKPLDGYQLYTCMNVYYDFLKAKYLIFESIDIFSALLSPCNYERPPLSVRRCFFAESYKDIEKRRRPYISIENHNLIYEVFRLEEASYKDIFSGDLEKYLEEYYNL